MKAKVVLGGAALTLATVPAASWASAPAPVWVVDRSASRLDFTGAMNGRAFTGVFRRWTVAIQFDPKNLGGSSVVAIIDTASAATGDQSRDEALPTSDWFATSAIPRATFSASRFRELGSDRYMADGLLTIRNVRRQVDLPFTLAFAGRSATMRGTLTIDRRTFGVGRGQFATGDTVATSVRIGIVVKASRK